MLEDSPRFNPGKAAVFTHEGTNSLDASIMDGATLRAGAVAGVQRVKNPVLLARAFVSFFRGDQGRGSGHGIGLTIVKRLADRFGWEVGMSSQPDDGTTVSVIFPHSQRL